MAGSKWLRTARARNGKIEKDWPVSKYPYVVERPYTDPRFFESLNKAKAHLNGLIKDFEGRMGMLDRDVPKTCARALEMIQQLGENGGQVHLILAPYTGTSFDAEVIRRAA